MPETTVLIPTYNCGRYIKEAINGVLSQGYTDYELLIIDDGSTDNTEDIITSINDERIVYHKNSSNRGIVDSLNYGLEFARGKYIARMDADDILVGNRLHDQVNFLNNNPEYCMVGGWYQLISQEGKLKKSLKTEEKSEKIQLGLLFRNQFAHPAVTMRTEIARQLLYSNEYPCVEDYDLWCRMAEVGKTTNLPYLYLSYRWHNTNTCSTKQKELKSSVVALLSRELDKYKIEYTIEELSLHAAICFNYGFRYFNSNERMFKLYAWLDKILTSPLIVTRFGEIFARSFKDYILKNYCAALPPGIYLVNNEKKPLC